jgi:hypothetical protein
MFKVNNITLLKRRLVYFITSIYILSLFFEDYFKFELEFLRFSIVEIIFITILFLTLLIHKLNFIKFIFKFDKKNILEIIIYTILVLKIIKYLLNFQNYYNLYELLIWIYMLSIYIVFKFYLISDKNLVNYIENSFITVSLIISIHILYLFLLYKLGYESNGFWTIKDTTYYPYAGTSSINFKSIFRDYNQAAHLVAPGFLFLLSRFNNKLISTLLIIFYFAVMYLMKSKFLIIFFGILGIYLITKNLNVKNAKLTKVFLLSSIIGLVLFYIIITHLIIIEKGMINSSNFDLFKKYYFTDFVISLNNYDIYGSLFLKLKYTVIELANSYNYILFDSSNYFNHEIVLKNFDHHTDPHSVYFGALANYGIIGFLVFLGFPIYIVLEYLKNLNLKETYKDSLIYFLIIVMIFIEAIIIDLFHTQFIWIIFAMYIFKVYFKKIV